ncbi:MAG: AraC family transcriptional regulator [Alphaproteobacteria bacterium]|nr:AraC family transcriptional regulator [Alphaproteobacteria bacterium]
MDILSDVLGLLKLQGTLYFRTEFSPPWGIEVPAFENVARFHLVHRGRCWLSVAGVDAPVLLEQGDLVIVTHGAQHRLSDPADALARSVDEVVTQSGFTGEGALVYGEPGQGHDTQLVCGHFAFDKDAGHPLLDALPPFIHVRNTGDVSHLWLEGTLKLIGSEAGGDSLGNEFVTLRLSEIIFAQAIRAYLAADGQTRQVFRGLADAHISRSLHSLHQEPEAAWTLEKMARRAGLSRTAFASRFHECMGMTPMQYLTGWRMQVGRQLLTESDLSILDVAERSGYRSEAAFGRVFRRHFEASPARYRRSRQSEVAVGH